MNKDTVIYPAKLVKDCRNICQAKCCEHFDNQPSGSGQDMNKLDEAIKKLDHMFNICTLTNCSIETFPLAEALALLREHKADYKELKKNADSDHEVAVKTCNELANVRQGNEKL